MKNIYKYVNCPVCDATEKIVLPFYKVRFDHYRLAEVSVCKKCSHLYLSKRWTEEKYSAFYKEEYRKSVGFNKTGDETLFFEDTKLRGAEIVDFVKHFIDKKSRILEIGCGNGGILKSFLDAGFVNLIGVEPNIIEANTAREKYGLNVVQGEPNFANFDNNYFDLILIVATIDHLTKPKEYLSNIREKLKPNGKLFIDGFDIEAQMDLGVFVPKMDHPSYYSGITIGLLLRKTGFKMLRYFKSNSFFSPYYPFTGSLRDRRMGFRLLAELTDQDKIDLVDEENYQKSIRLLQKNFLTHYSFKAKVFKKLTSLFKR